MPAQGLWHRRPFESVAARSRTRAGHTSAASARCATPVVGASCRAVRRAYVCRARCGSRRVDRQAGVGVARVDRGAGVVGVAPVAHAQLQLRLRLRQLRRRGRRSAVHCADGEEKARD